jgi:DNA (cytosine-5)-methyltransferase 1
MPYRVVELCAGGGGQALGLEAAGFHHAAAVEIDPQCCTTLRTNRPSWSVFQQDIRHFHAEAFYGIDLVAGGVPCPPFSIAGKQLGAADERDMFPTALDIVSRIKPRAVLLENVPGFASEKFRTYRRDLQTLLQRLGYQSEYQILQASDYGVPQLRPRFVLVGLRASDAEHFRWPLPMGKAPTVGETLMGLMGENGWLGVEDWAKHAAGIAPTIVGGSMKHGGPDLGPTRARMKWRSLQVDGLGIADESPGASFPSNGLPRLTVPMVARIQGFPDTWKVTGKKTAAYRQVGNAFPPPVAKAVGLALIAAFERRGRPHDLFGSHLDSRLLETSPRYNALCRKPVRKR